VTRGLVARGLGKRFPGVVALKGVDLTLLPGEVHALVGANGAGKSTLIKILSGYYPSYEGEVWVDGRPVRLVRPDLALKHGIEVVHQEVDTALVPTLSVAENLFLERIAEGRLGTLLSPAGLRARAERALKELGFALDPAARAGELSLHQKQLLVIARAMLRELSYLILDEPTAALSQREAERLLALVAELRSRGVGVLYVTHRLAEVERLADRVSVLRAGEKVAEFSRPLDLEAVVRAMLGAPPGALFPEKDPDPGELVLKVRGLALPPRVRGVDLDLRRGEVVALTGLAGAGKTELLKLLFGAFRPAAGTILLAGRPVRFTSPTAAVRAGVYLVPEERRREGLILEKPVRENLSLPFLERFSRALGWLDRRAERAHALRVIERVRLVPPDPEKPVRYLSGGNQQKVVVGRWITGAPRVLLFDEATQGVDVGAKSEIYRLARESAKKAAVLFATSEIDEALGVADRVLVMRDGRVVAELPGDLSRREEALAYATGARR